VDTITTASDALGVPLLVILDQFEEYFLYHPRDEVPGRFDVELARAVARRTTPANVLVSLREDALAGLDRFEDRIPNLLDNLLRIDHLDRDEAREAIERPLAVWRELGEEGPGEAAPDLVEALLDEVEEGTLRAGETGAGTHVGGTRRIRTPYLQLVLARLWDEEAKVGSPVLRLATLERLGGAERIVATHLDGAMDTLGRREQAVAAQVFRYLVTPSGMKIAQSGPDLAAYAELPESSVTPVLDRLTGGTRILQAVDESRYEIYHDALAAPILAWRRRWERRSDRRRARWRMLATIALASSVLGLLALFGNVGEPELATVDTRFAVRGAQEPPADVVIVAIDDASLQAEGAWPVGRRKHADVITELAHDGARVIAYDIQFTEPSDDPAADAALVRAVRRADAPGIDVVLATTEVTANGTTLIFGGGRTLKFSKATPANSTVVPDEDGTVRRMPWGLDNVRTLAIVAAGLKRGAPIAPAGMPADPAWIDFAGGPGTVRTFSFSDVLEGRTPAAEFRDKVVVVGATAPSLPDFRPTSTSPSMSGAELHANAIATALLDFPLREPSDRVDIPLILLFTLAPALLALRFTRVRTALLSVALAAVYLVAAQLAFGMGWILPIVLPLVGLGFPTLTVLVLGAAAPRVSGR
jgi:CHASE2 domain-containing sensor protein